jgi:hypothetical protein
MEISMFRFSQDDGKVLAMEYFYGFIFRHPGSNFSPGFNAGFLSIIVCQNKDVFA